MKKTTSKPAAKKPAVAKKPAAKKSPTKPTRKAVQANRFHAYPEMLSIVEAELAQIAKRLHRIEGKVDEMFAAVIELRNRPTEPFATAHQPADEHADEVDLTPIGEGEEQ
jgi:hypothetical protein